MSQLSLPSATCFTGNYIFHLYPRTPLPVVQYLLRSVDAAIAGSPPRSLCGLAPAVTYRSFDSESGEEESPYAPVTAGRLVPGHCFSILDLPDYRHERWYSPVLVVRLTRFMSFVWLDGPRASVACISFPHVRLEPLGPDVRVLSYHARPLQIWLVGTTVEVVTNSAPPPGHPDTFVRLCLLRLADSLAYRDLMDVLCHPGTFQGGIEFVDVFGVFPGDPFYNHFYDATEEYTSPGSMRRLGVESFRPEAVVLLECFGVQIIDPFGDIFGFLVGCSMSLLSPGIPPVPSLQLARGVEFPDDWRL